MIAQIGLTVLLLWVIAYAWAEYRRAPLIGTVAVLDVLTNSPDMILEAI